MLRKAKDAVAFDTETTGLHRHQGHRIFGYSTCDEYGESDWRRIDGADGSDPQKAKLRLRQFWQDRSIAKVGHNMKFDLGMVEAELGSELITGHEIHDTMIQAHVIQNDLADRKLKRLAWELAGFEREDESAVKAFVKEGGDYSMVAPEIMARYATRDAERTMLLHLFFWPKIRANSRWRESYNEEVRLIPVTLAMENRGLLLDVTRTKTMRDNLLEDAEYCLDEIERICGDRINPNSPSQLQWLLFKYADLPILKHTVKSGQPQTDKNVLASLRERYPENRLLDLVLQYRSWAKGASTFQRYLNLRDTDGVIHPSIHTCAARTGRESCSNPNLQNVQKDAALLNPYPVPERSVFRPRPGYVWFLVDYSGIELRLLVHYSHEQELVDCINKGEDPHVLAAELFYGKEWRAASRKRRNILRSASKNANFAIPYGANGTKIAATLGKKASDGNRLLAWYRDRWPRLAFLNRDIAQTVREQGYVETTFGRRLYVSQDKAYVGTNYLIQGTAAEVLKRAQNRTHDYCLKTTGGEAYPILPIHDEIIFEYPRKRLKDAPEFLRGLFNVMTDFNCFSVPLAVEAEMVTAYWNKKKEVKL